MIIGDIFINYRNSYIVYVYVYYMLMLMIIKMKLLISEPYYGGWALLRSYTE